MEDTARVRGASQVEAETEVRRSSKPARTGRCGRAALAEPSLTLTIRQPPPPVSPSRLPLSCDLPLTSAPLGAGYVAQEELETQGE